jgi:Resolvase, N terminal domain
MERPALKRLLEDIKTGKVQIVVVYKVDRLTRSVDVLDAYGGPEARWSRNANGGLRRSAPVRLPDPSFTRAGEGRKARFHLIS